MTLALPPERVDRLFAGMGCHEFGSFDSQMRNTMFGHMSLNVVAPAATYANPKQMEFIQHSVQLYKEFIRPFLPECKVYHPTPEAKKALSQGYTFLEISAKDASRGVFGVFTLSGSADKEISFTLKGADPSRDYMVTLDNSRCSFTMSGAALSMNGLTVRIPASMSSELITYKAL